jgi:hypothetical protein
MNKALGTALPIIVGTHSKPTNGTVRSTVRLWTGVCTLPKYHSSNDLYLRCICTLPCPSPEKRTCSTLVGFDTRTHACAA